MLHFNAAAGPGYRDPKPPHASCAMPRYSVAALIALACGFGLAGRAAEDQGPAAARRRVCDRSSSAATTRKPATLTGNSRTTRRRTPAVGGAAGPRSATPTRPWKVSSAWSGPAGETFQGRVGVADRGPAGDADGRQVLRLRVVREFPVEARGLPRSGRGGASVAPRRRAAAGPWSSASGRQVRNASEGDEGGDRVARHGADRMRGASGHGTRPGGGVQVRRSRALPG